MHRQQDWSKFKNILCIRADNMGDVLMTTPAFKALKKAVEGRKLTLLAEENENRREDYAQAAGLE